MTKVDQFESAFRAAARDVFVYEPKQIRSVLIVCDLGGEEATAYGNRVQTALSAHLDGEVEWRTVGREDFTSVESLIALVEEAEPDLTCTYRNLFSLAWRFPYGIGIFVTVLTQTVAPPVMLLPHPDSEFDAIPHLTSLAAVMAITDHLSGDQKLVNRAAAMTAKGGTLWLAHVEDEVRFEYVMTAIGKLPAVNTDAVREGLKKQLLKDPHDYVATCRGVLEAADLGIQVGEVVTFGHHLNEYKRIVTEHAVDLLVMNTKDEEQMAMHGLAHPLAVELRQIPLLLL